MKKHWTLIVPGALLLCASPAFAIDLRQAVQAALASNPDIRQAIHNKEATREERRQGQGRFYPTVSTEVSSGVRSFRNPSRRRIGLDNSTLYPLEADFMTNIVAEMTSFHHDAVQPAING